MMERDLPKGWELVAIEQIGEIVTGGTPPKASPDYYGHEVPFYKPTDLNAGYHTSSASENLSALGATKARLLPEKSILVTCIGATIGKTGFIRKRGTSNQQINSIIPFAFISPEYIYYACISADFQTQINKNSSSTTLPILNKSRFSKLTFPLPPLAEQKRIVTKLDAAFAHLEKIKARLIRIPELLKRFREAVLTQAVTGKLTEEWREGKENVEWKNRRIGELVTSIQAGKNFNCPSYPVEYDTVGLVKISAVTWGEFNPKETKTVTDLSMIDPNLFIKAGDFLFSRANTLELVGCSVVVKQLDYRIMLSDKVWRVNFAEEVTKTYTNYFVKSRIGRAEIEARATGNQLSMRNISQAKFKEIRISLPTVIEQKEILSRIESLLSTADAIESQYNSLKQKIDALPQALLAKAFRGELVPQDPHDEPAAVLLEKIRKEMGKLGRNQGVLDFVESYTNF